MKIITGHVDTRNIKEKRKFSAKVPIDTDLEPNQALYLGKVK